MPVAPLPMSVYTRLHDPVAHAKSEEGAKQVSGSLRVLESGSYWLNAALAEVLARMRLGGTSVPHLIHLMLWTASRGASGVQRRYGGPAEQLGLRRVRSPASDS